MATTRQKEAAKKEQLPDNVYAFPTEPREPLTDARHVRNSIARFDQVGGITDAEKDAAWKRIMKAAKKYGVDISESSWRELGRSPKKKPSPKK